MIKGEALEFVKKNEATKKAPSWKLSIPYYSHDPNRTEYRWENSQSSSTHQVSSEDRTPLQLTSIPINIASETFNCQSLAQINKSRNSSGKGNCKGLAATNLASRKKGLFPHPMLYLILPTKASLVKAIPIHRREARQLGLWTSLILTNMTSHKPKDGKGLYGWGERPMMTKQIVQCHHHWSKTLPPPTLPLDWNSNLPHSIDMLLPLDSSCKSPSKNNHHLPISTRFTTIFKDRFNILGLYLERDSKKEIFKKNEKWKKINRKEGGEM